MWRDGRFGWGEGGGVGGSSFCHKYVHYMVEGAGTVGLLMHQESRHNGLTHALEVTNGLLKGKPKRKKNTFINIFKEHYQNNSYIVYIQ